LASLGERALGRQRQLTAKTPRPPRTANHTTITEHSVWLLLASGRLDVNGN